MKSFIIGLIFMISPFLSNGHNPLAAKYHLEVGQKASLLTINLSQDGVNHTFVKKYGKDKYSALSNLELEELIVDYVKDNFLLKIENNTIELNKGGIKLGSHQTDLKFVLPPISNSLNNLFISIPAFQENDNHQTIFTHNIKGAKYQILSNSNNFESTILFIEVKHFSTSALYIALLAVLLIGVIYLLSKKNNSNQIATSNL